MEGSRLEVGLYVYIFDKDHEKAPVVGKITEDLGGCKNSSGNIYRLIDENNKEYEIIYPESKTNYYILTRSEYLKRLRNYIKEKENGECKNFHHEFGKWFNDVWHEDTKWTSCEGSILGYYEATSCHGKTRECQVCGYREHKVESKELIKRVEFTV